MVIVSLYSTLDIGMYPWLETLRTAAVFCQNWEVMVLVVSAAAELDLVEILFIGALARHTTSE